MENLSNETRRWLAQFDTVENALGWREKHLSNQLINALVNEEEEVFPADDKVYMELLALTENHTVDYKVYQITDDEPLSSRFDD